MGAAGSGQAEAGFGLALVGGWGVVIKREGAKSSPRFAKKKADFDGRKEAQEAQKGGRESCIHRGMTGRGVDRTEGEGE